ncbi:hypothetical protein E2542_SST09287 [Spatholobus suberectus]|nr:hypothetical protein E2542_SST09287 [Spatholobus suberectus]
MPLVRRTKSLASLNSSKGFSSRERITTSSNLSSSSIVIGWRRCYCGGREVLVTSQSARNPGRMFWACPNLKRGIHYDYFRWVDENDGGLDGVNQVVA